MLRTAIRSAPQNNLNNILLHCHHNKIPNVLADVQNEYASCSQLCVCSSIMSSSASFYTNARRHQHLAWAAIAATTVAFGTACASATSADRPSSEQKQPSIQLLSCGPPWHDAPVFYQYAICPWCNKAKAVLHFCNVPYHEVDVHPLFKSELNWSEYKKVPVMMLASGDQMNGSTEIVDAVWEATRPPTPPNKSKRSWYLLIFLDVYVALQHAQQPHV
jgi:glutaredoxin